MRLNQFLAAAGLGSRRACETLIREGRVTINGHTVQELATRVSPDDCVKVGQRRVRHAPAQTIVLHKPRGVITTCDDPQARRTVLDLVPSNLGRLYPVGRLDRESEGLVLLTNDGALAQRLTHPSYEVEKEYEVTLDKPFDLTLKPKLLRGFMIEGGRATMHRVHFYGKTRAAVVLRQGIKRQIRLMFFALGYEVTRLRRVRLGPVVLDGLPLGSWRPLTRGELRDLADPRQPTIGTGGMGSTAVLAGTAGTAGTAGAAG